MIKIVRPSLFSDLPQCLLVSAEAEIPGSTNPVHEQETQQGQVVLLSLLTQHWGSEMLGWDV